MKAGDTHSDLVAFLLGVVDRFSLLGVVALFFLRLAERSCDLSVLSSLISDSLSLSDGFWL